jgi:GT2 family glycosyltransferase
VLQLTVCEKSRLLVVTPTLGTSPYLGAAVESAQRLGLDVDQVLIAPTSATRGLMRDFPHCTVVAEPSSGGMYAAINAALGAAAPWDWFTYLNDDDLLAPGLADVARRHMARGDVNAIAYGDVRWVDAADRNLGLMPVERRSAHVGFVMKLGLAPLTQQGALVSREVYEQLGGFDTRYRLAADFDFWARAFAAGATFQYYPCEVARWRIHGAQASMDRDAAHAEGRAIASTVALAALPPRLWWERLRFLALNTRRYVQRYRTTGVWTSKAIFMAAQTPSQ